MKQTQVDEAQEALEKTIKLFRDLEKQTCADAVNSANAGYANASVTAALGHLLHAKSEGTLACLALGTVQPRFGGK